VIHTSSNIRFVRTGLLVALFFIALLPTVAHAEGEAAIDTIALTPTTKRINVKAGERITDSFTIINSGQTAYDFKVYAKPYSVKDAGYEPIFNQETDFSDAYKWVSLPSITYHLVPGQKINVPFDLIVSAGARSGGHYGAIFAEAQGASIEGQSGITNNKAVGMLLYVNVAGSSVTSGSLKSVDMPWYQPAAPLSATATISNSGETDFITKVTFAVMDIAGDVKYQTSNEYPVLPKTDRSVKFSWDKSPWFGLYKARISTEVLGKTDTKETYVVIAPRWLLFAAGLAIILGAVDVVRRKRTTTKRKSR